MQISGSDKFLLGVGIVGAVSLALGACFIGLALHGHVVVPICWTVGSALLVVGVVAKKVWDYSNQHFKAQQSAPQVKSYGALPSELPESRGTTFGKATHTYSGKHSEGNRFITNNMT